MRTQPIAAHEAAAVVADAAEGAARGRLADAGGPEVHRRADLVRQRVRADGRRPILRLPMVYRGFRAGHNLCSEARVGNVTWQEHLEATRSSGGRS